MQCGPNPKRQTKPTERKRRSTTRVTHRSMKPGSSRSVQDHCGAKSWRLDAKKCFRILLSSSLLSAAAESGCVIFDPRAEEASANTHKHTQSNIRSKLIEASAVQTMTGLLQNTQDWHAALSVCQELLTGLVLVSHAGHGSRGCYHTEASRRLCENI